MSGMSASRHRGDGASVAATSSSAPANSTRNNAALGMIGGTFVGIMAFTAPFVFMQLRSSLPYMATPRSKVEKALKFISHRTSGTTSNHHHMESKSIHTMKQPQLPTLNNAKLNFVDLGSGDGTTILTAASLNYNATGFELNPTLWFISSMRRIFSSSNPSSTIRNNSQFVLGDMFTNHVAKRKLNEAKCVMIFGVLPLMPKIANLVQSECQPGCYLMSYRFRVPLIEKQKSANDEIAGKSDRSKTGNARTTQPSLVGGINASLIYDEGEMRIYQLENDEGTDLPCNEEFNTVRIKETGLRASQI